jgi:hypothetical protein
MHLCLVIAISLLLSSAARADDACLPIANAFLLQSEQPQMDEHSVIKLNTGEEAHSRQIETLSTEYSQYKARAWEATGAYPLSQRRDRRSPEQFIRESELADCRIVGPSGDPTKPSTIYSFRSNLAGMETAAKIWIDDSSKLPLQIEGSGPGMNDRPTGISSTFLYGEDVIVPAEAKAADMARLARMREQTQQLQMLNRHW